MKLPIKLTSMTAALAMATVVFATPVAAEDHSGDNHVTVVHGIPGVDVDVYVNGDLAIEDFAPETVTDPIPLPDGEYDLAVRPADADADSDPILSAEGVALADEVNASVVAHLDEDGDPTLAVFVNDVSNTAEGEARVTVRHTASAPAVDILSGDSVVFADVSNGEEASADIPAGTIPVAVAATGTTDAVLGPIDLELREGTNTIVYAVGSLEDGNLTVLAQSIAGLHEAPTAVHTGNSGLAAQGSNFTLLATALGGLVLLGSGGAALAYARRD